LSVQSIKLSDVIDLDFLQKFQDNFAKSLEMASITTDINGNPVTNPSCFTEFCMDLTRSTKGGNKRCVECDRRGGQQASKTGRPYVYKCHAGLMDFAAPIMLEDKQIGSILGGQIIPNEPDLDSFRQNAIEIGVDPDKYIQAVKKVRIVKEENINAAAEVLFIVANTLSKIGYQQYKLNSMSSILSDNLEHISLGSEQLTISAADINENQKKLNNEIFNVKKLSEDINQILELINNISSKTNMLGLNAAIEASRAGESGRGFSIVANEIRKLSLSSKETVSKIKEITSHIQSSVDVAIKTSDTILTSTEDQSAAILATSASIESILHLSEDINNLTNKI